MLNIKRFIVNPVEENLYVVSDETQEAAIIDCGCFAMSEWMEVKNYIEKQELRLVLLLNTHTHFDHVMGLSFAMNEYQLTPAFASEDLPIYQQLPEQIAMFMGQRFADRFDTSFTKQPVTLLKDKQEITLGNHKLQVIATPGHTPGGICLYDADEHVLFSGDSLFQGSIGRTDLPGGDYRTLVTSLMQHILTLPPDTTVYPGHGETTTIERELNYNPYL